MKKAIAFLMAALMIAALAVPAFAIDTPDTFELFTPDRAQADAKIYAAMVERATEVDISEFQVPAVDAALGKPASQFISAVYANHPEAFYVNTGKIRFTSSDPLSGVDLEYYSNMSAQSIAEAQAAVDGLAAYVNAQEVNDIDRVLFALNFLKERTYSGRTEDGKYQNAYDAIMTDSADKFALASALTWVLKALGVEAYYCEGAWNTCPFVMVVIGGKCYFVDTATNAMETNAAVVSEQKMISHRNDMKSSTPITVCEWKSVKGLCTTTTNDNAWWNIHGKEMAFYDGYWYFGDGVDLYRSKTTTPNDKEKLTNHNRSDYFWFDSTNSLLDIVAAGDCIYFSSTDAIWRYNPETGEETALYRLTDTEKSKGKICDLELDGNRIVYNLAKKANVLAEPGYYVYTGSVVYLCDEHVFGEWFVSDPGTCVTHATEKRVCENCGIAQRRESELYGDHVVTDWNITRVATCLETGEKNGVCTLCGEPVDGTIPIADHTPGEWTVTKQATCGAEGEEQATCTVEGCGELVTRPIPATGNHTDANADNVCDDCGADLLANLKGLRKILAQFRAFLKRISLFFRNLFSKK